jgi:hypothetical protein
MWSAPFRWEGAVLVGKTAIGRTTARLLAVNHAMTIAVREAMIQEGLAVPWNMPERPHQSPPSD